MKKNRFKAFVVVFIFSMAYFLLPFIAGLFGYSDARGPRIYPVSYHVGLVRFGYEIRYGTKLRMNPREAQINRTWFYVFEYFGGEKNR